MKFSYWLVFITLTGMASLWLWLQQIRMTGEHQALSARLLRMQTQLPVPPGSRASAKSSARLPLHAPAGEARTTAPLDLMQFTELARKITKLESEGQTPGRQERMRVAVTELFQRLRGTPPEELKQILNEIPNLKLSADGRSQITSAIMGLLAQSDPPAAAAYAVRVNARPGTLEAALRGWAKMDVAAAARWLEDAKESGKLPSHVSAEQLQMILLPHQFAADPSGAVAARIAQLQPANLNDLFQETARLLEEGLPQQQFVENLLRTPSLPPEAVGSFIHQVARESSIPAAVALLNRVEDKISAEEFDKVAVLAATARIDGDTPAQADWLLKNLRGTDRTPAIRQFVETWTRADFNATATWLKAQPASEVQDIAVAAFAPLVAGKEPPSAVDWALTIQEPARKADTLAGIFRGWHTHQPEMAEAYLRSKGLTPPSFVSGK